MNDIQYDKYYIRLAEEIYFLNITENVDEINKEYFIEIAEKIFMWIQE